MLFKFQKRKLCYTFANVEKNGVIRIFIRHIKLTQKAGVNININVLHVNTM